MFARLCLSRPIAAARSTPRSPCRRFRTPKSLPMVSEYLGQLPTPLHRRSRERPIDMRHVDRPCTLSRMPSSTQPRACVWFKDLDRLVHADGSEASEAEHRAAIAYASDYLPLEPAAPSRQVLAGTGPQERLADHAMWFHPGAPTSGCCTCWIPRARRGGRMLAQGSIFNRSGELVATVAQEMMFRPLNIELKPSTASDTGKRQSMQKDRVRWLSHTVFLMF